MFCPQKISGVKEFDLMTKSMHKFIKHAEFEFYGEHHSLHEIVLDWKVTVSNKIAGNYHWIKTNYLDIKHFDIHL